MTEQEDIVVDVLPRESEIPRVIAMNSVLSLSDHAAVSILAMRRHSTGLMFEVDIRWRRDKTSKYVPFELRDQLLTHLLPTESEPPEGAFEFRAELDGFEVLPTGPEVQKSGSCLHLYKSDGNASSFRLEYWLSPLPRMTLKVGFLWPRQGSRGSLDLDVGLITASRAKMICLWQPDETGMHGYRGY